VGNDILWVDQLQVVFKLLRSKGDCVRPTRHLTGTPGISYYQETGGVIYLSFYKMEGAHGNSASTRAKAPMPDEGMVLRNRVLPPPKDPAERKAGDKRMGNEQEIAEMAQLQQQQELLMNGLKPVGVAEVPLNMNQVLDQMEFYKQQCSRFMLALERNQESVRTLEREIRHLKRGGGSQSGMTTEGSDYDRSRHDRNLDRRGDPNSSTSKEIRKRQVPPNFNGQRVRTWITAMERWFRIGGLGAYEQYNAGVALQEEEYKAMWETQRGSRPETWESLRDFMIKWHAHESEHELRKLISEIKWKGSVVGLGHGILNIVDGRECFSQKELVSFFLGKLPTRLKLTGLAPGVSSLPMTEVIEHYKEWESELNRAEGMTADMAVLPGHRSRDHSGQSSPTFQKYIGKYPDQRLRGEEFQRRQPSVGGRRSPGEKRESPPCGDCRGKGHLGDQCPNKDPDKFKQGVSCFRCGGEGHFSRECTTQRKEYDRGQVPPRSSMRQADKGNDYQERRVVRVAESGNGKV